MPCSAWIRRASNRAWAQPPLTTPACPGVQVSSRKAACRGPPAPRRSPPSSHAADIGIPDTLPSRIVARADEPFERFDPEDLRLLGEWLERALAALAAAPQPASRAAPARQADRPAADHESLARDRLGNDPSGPYPQPGTPPPSGAGVRRQPVDAAVRHDLSASHACSSSAAEGNSTRGLRVLDVADPVDRRAVAPLGGGGVGTGQCEGHRPVRRDASRSLHRRAGFGLTRQRAARCGGDHRVRRVGQRSA